MARPSKYSPELRERAVRMVFEHAPDHRLYALDTELMLQRRERRWCRLHRPRRPAELERTAGEQLRAAGPWRAAAWKKTH